MKKPFLNSLEDISIWDITLFKVQQVNPIFVLYEPEGVH